MARSGALVGSGMEKFWIIAPKKPRDGSEFRAMKRWTKELRAQGAAVGAAGHTRLYLFAPIKMYR
jgi:hypothetical protein